MKTPHIHAEIIKAWADGEIIQYFRKPYGWDDCSGNSPAWDKDASYRVKPKPAPDRVYYGVFENDGSSSLGSCFTRFHDEGDQIKVTFDGETGKLKSVEVL